MKHNYQNWNSRGRRVEYDFSDRGPSIAQIVIWALFCGMLLAGILWMI
jgi:hypothetical protein